MTSSKYTSNLMLSLYFATLGHLIVTKSHQVFPLTLLRETK